MIDFNYKNCFCVTLFIYLISLTLRSTPSSQENFFCMLVCAYKLFSFLGTSHSLNSLADFFMPHRFFEIISVSRRFSFRNLYLFCNINYLSETDLKELFL